MISPDVAQAVTRLENEGVLAPEQARLFGRVARGELVSLSGGIHALLYLGVLAITTGVGLLLKDRIADLGPLALSVGIGLIAALCFAWVSRQAAPFSPNEVASPHFAFDYVLVMGALIAAADLAFVETQLRPLGHQWAFHLRLVAFAYGALALRYDSRTLFGLGLTSFAAWRGVSSIGVEHTLFGFFNETDAIRLNTFACGVVFILIGALLVRKGIKVHFEPTAVHLGWFLVLQAIAWGIFDGWQAILYRAALIAVGSVLAWISWRRARFTLFVFGMLAAYLGCLVSLAAVFDELLLAFLVAGSSIFLVIALAQLHRHFPKESTE